MDEHRLKHLHDRIDDLEKRLAAYARDNEAQHHHARKRSQLNQSVAMYAFMIATGVGGLWVAGTNAASWIKIAIGLFAIFGVPMIAASDYLKLDEKNDKFPWWGRL